MMEIHWGPPSHPAVGARLRLLPLKRATRALWMSIVLMGLGSGLASGAEATFDQGNRLYEEGRFREAAAMYQRIIDRDGATSTLYFNLGNAHFKAGQTGRAIAAYLQGRRLDPRDPSLRFNLRFARKQVSGEETPAESVWRRALTGLTMNEWTLLFVVVYWVWFVLLCLREARPAWRRTVSGYTATAGALTLVLGMCLAGAWSQWHGTQTAVVVVQETLVRYGPLEESQVHYPLRDGSEVTVLDRKGGDQTWLQVRDDQAREGWLKAGEVIMPRASRDLVIHE